MGCGAEAYALLELRRVVGANVITSIYLCDVHAEMIDDKIGYMDEPDFN
jgi:hypothetical protein